MSSSVNLCFNCAGKNAKLRCSNCKVIYFCTKECQVASWNGHKKNCKKPKPIDEQKSKAPAVVGGFLNKKTTFDLYPEEPDIKILSKEDVVKNEYKRMLKELVNEVTAIQGRPGEVLDKGLLQQLLNKDSFQKIVYPGISNIEEKTVPKTFKELITSKEYMHILETIMPQVIKKASSILEGVKRRGAESGDVMDIETEKVVSSQILKEAFAREVVMTLQDLAKQASIMKGFDKENYASPSEMTLEFEQMSDLAMEQLFDEKRGYTIIDNYMGEDWFDLIESDIDRFSKNNKFTQQVSGRESMLWVELNFFEEKYPALEELVVTLHGLPYEINKKNEKMKLSKALPGSKQLATLKDEGDQRPQRFDGGRDKFETGVCLSVTYFFPNKKKWREEEGGKLVLYVKGEGAKREGEEEIEGERVEIAPYGDRLVILKSRDVPNGLTEAHPQNEKNQRFFLNYFIQGEE